MPSLRHTSPTVSPLAKSRSASRKTRWICSAVRRLRMSPSLDQCSRRDYHITWTNFWGADQVFPPSPHRPLSLLLHLTRWSLRVVEGRPPRHRRDERQERLIVLVWRVGVCFESGE